MELKFSEEGASYAEDRDVVEEHPMWRISKIKYSTKHNTGFRNSLQIVFHLERRSLYYTCTIIVPSALLSILTLGAFFIPNDSGEKISCGLAIFLSFVVFLIQMGDIVPENSNGISVIGKNVFHKFAYGSHQFKTTRNN